MTTQEQNTLIPVISDLVIPGDPRMKKDAHAKTSAESNYSDNLNQRINELESAIGQTEVPSVGRAYAIRAEASRAKHSSLKKDPPLDDLLNS